MRTRRPLSCGLRRSNASTLPAFRENHPAKVQIAGRRNAGTLANQSSTRTAGDPGGALANPLRGEKHPWHCEIRICLTFGRASREPNPLSGRSNPRQRHNPERIAAAELTAVGVAHPDPCISHLLVVHLRIVNQNVEAEPRHREAADREETIIEPNLRLFSI